MDFITQPWPWYVAGIIIGLTVPTLLLIGNKQFGISSSLRHACAACLPADIKFFKYDWKKESWNLFFAGGLMIGGAIAATLLRNPEPIQVHAQLASDLAGYGITDFSNPISADLFSWDSLFSLRGFIIMVLGGFMVGFGARYGGGCTSGHAIMGLSTLQWPSLVATMSFMVGGFLSARLLVPFILGL